jgi:WD40 repeat protein
MLYAHGVENVGSLIDIRRKAVHAKLTVERANNAAFSPDGSLLVLGLLDGGVQFCDGDSGRPVLRVEAFAGEPQNRVRSLAFSKDGKRLAAGTFDGRVCAWEVGRPAAANAPRQ